MARPTIKTADLEKIQALVLQITCATLAIRLLRKVRKEGFKRGQRSNKKD